MELLEVKKKITYKMKNIIHMPNSRLDTTEEQWIWKQGNGNDPNWSKREKV